MSRYFFHVRDAKEIPDSEGLDLFSVDEARTLALRYAEELLSENRDIFWDGTEWNMRVTDDRDMTLFTLDFAATNAPSARNI